MNYSPVEEYIEALPKAKERIKDANREVSKARYLINRVRLASNVIQAVTNYQEKVQEYHDALEWLGEVLYVTQGRVDISLNEQDRLVDEARERWVQTIVEESTLDEHIDAKIDYENAKNKLYEMFREFVNA